jgi:hypothetical protein
LLKIKKGVNMLIKKIEAEAEEGTTLDATIEEARCHLEKYGDDSTVLVFEFNGFKFSFKKEDFELKNVSGVLYQVELYYRNIR